MNRIIKIAFVYLLANSIACIGKTCIIETSDPADTTTANKVAVWVTNGTQSKLLKSENSFSIVRSGTVSPSINLININFGIKLQEIEGFGAAITGSSAYLINKKLNVTQRKAFLKELFDPETGIGISYLRITMGASDFSREDFTYDDLPVGQTPVGQTPVGQTDPMLSRFSIAKDRDDLLPVLKSVVALQPSVKIMATPWSAPAWMKTSGKLGGGSLKRDRAPAVSSGL